MPPGVPRDLRHFRNRQAAKAAAVEFLEAREGDMLDVEIKPHADRVGGDQIVELARLEPRDFRIARLRAQGPPPPRRAPRTTPNPPGNPLPHPGHPPGKESRC